MSRRALASLLVALAVLGASCTNEEDPPPDDEGRSAPQPVAGGRAVVGVLGEPPTLDPYSPRATDLTFAIVRPVYPSLFRVVPDGSIRPDLARSLDEGPRRATVRLRRARWSNGRLITAHDVVASVHRAGPRSGFSRIRRARARSRGTVELAGRVDDWEQVLARLAFVLPRGRASRPGGAFGGPYRIASSTPGLEIIYRRNPRWEGSRPYVGRVTVTFVTGLLMMIRLLELGRLDAAALPSSVNLDQRLDTAGLEHDEALGYESLVVDFASSSLTRSERIAVIDAVDTKLLDEGLVRDAGRVTRTLHPTPEGIDGPFGADLGSRSKPVGTQLLLAPAGDELLQLFQRIIDRGLDRAGIDVDLVRLVPSELYGNEAIVNGIELRRVAGGPGLEDSARSVQTLDRYPLFQVTTLVSWRRGLNGVEVNPTYEGVLHNLEQWWWTGGRRP